MTGRSSQIPSRARQRARDKARYPKERARRIAYSKAYYQANKARVNAQYKERRKRDPQFRLAVNLRTRLNRALANEQRGGSAVRDLGCSIPEFRKYLEAQFVLGMTWDNYGSHWHIDHKIPISHFNLADPTEFKQACHYTNLQPLWAKDNYKKSDKLISFSEAS